MPTEGFRGSALDAEGIALIQPACKRCWTGAGPESFDANGSFVGGNILLGGDGSDLIEGRGGDDIIDGDKWLRVRIAVMSTLTPTARRATPSCRIPRQHDHPGYEGVLGRNQPRPAQDRPRHRSTGDATPDIDTAAYSDVRANYSFSALADGTLVVSNTGGANPLDGTDLLRNIEKLQFTDGTLSESSSEPRSATTASRRRARPPTTVRC